MIKLKAYAKINIYLKVLGKRNDGYHNLESLMVPINLYDELEFIDSDKDIIESNIDIENNIMYKAIKFIKEKYKINRCVKIKLNKNIPMSSGLGGGSSDLSTTLKGLNLLWDLNLNDEELGNISLLFGSDTLFFIYNKPAIIRGRGELIEFVKYSEKEVLILNPKIKVSTKDVFMEYNESDKGTNELEMALLRLYPNIKDFKSYYEKQGLELNLSGSGSTYFSFSNTKYISNDKYIEIKTKTIE